MRVITQPKFTRIERAALADYVEPELIATVSCPEPECVARHGQTILLQGAFQRGDITVGKCRRCNTISAFLVE